MENTGQEHHRGVSAAAAPAGSTKWPFILEKIKSGPAQNSRIPPQATYPNHLHLAVVACLDDSDQDIEAMIALQDPPQRPRWIRTRFLASCSQH